MENRRRAFRSSAPTICAKGMGKRLSTPRVEGSGAIFVVQRTAAIRWRAGLQRLQTASRRPHGSGRDAHGDGHVRKEPFILDYLNETNVPTQKNLHSRFIADQAVTRLI